MKSLRYLFIPIICAGAALTAGAQDASFVVADSFSHEPLPGASLYDRSGKSIGITDPRGHTPIIPRWRFPVTMRYVGFEEKTVDEAPADTLFMKEIQIELPEFKVETGKRKVLHILAYLREYSTLTTYTDTVFLFREKMVDFMLPSDKKSSFRGWNTPRIIKASSCYRFTDSDGLDSVSDVSRHHFSWSDWIGLGTASSLPDALRGASSGADTVMGKYSPAEIWTKQGDSLAIDVNVLADTLSRKWVPYLSGFFRDGLDFESFKIRYNYRNIINDSISPVDLTGYSFKIESTGRGHNMFRFNRVDEPFFVSTSAEVYILDKEYITVKEARKWERKRTDNSDIAIFIPDQAPDLQPEIMELLERVANIDKDVARLDFEPLPHVVPRMKVNRNFRLGNRVLLLLRDMTGISSILHHRNNKKGWREFKNSHHRGIRPVREE